jgi:hypothetical protein
VASRGALLRAYFLAAACIFEPSRAAERLAWARAAVLAEAISCCLLSNVDDACACNKTTAEWLVQEFTNGDDIADSYEYSPARRDDDGPNSPAWGASSLAGVLRELVNLQASGNAAVAGCLRGAVKNPMPLASSFITRTHTYTHSKLNYSVPMIACSGSNGSWHGLERRRKKRHAQEIRRCCLLARSRSAQEGAVVPKRILICFCVITPSSSSSPDASAPDWPLKLLLWYVYCIHRQRRGNCLHAYAWGRVGSYVFNV